MKKSVCFLLFIILVVASCTTDEYITTSNSTAKSREFTVVKSALKYYRANPSKFNALSTRGFAPDSIK